jgi:hypothetical protein
MKPNFEHLKKHYYSSNELATNFVDGKALFSEIGYDQGALIKENPNYVNTCATRVSLALIKAGINFTGRIKIKAGPYLGKMIEPGAKLLADQLSLPHVFGKPAVFRPMEFVPKVTGKRGVVLFWKITGYGGGHIDLIDVSDANAVCSSNCYFDSKEIWFWELV